MLGREELKQPRSYAKELLEDFKQTRLGQELRAEARKEALLQILNYSLQELEEKFGVENFKQTPLGQYLWAEIRQVGKLEAVPEILARGFTIEAVAEILKLEVEQVRQVAEKEK